MDPRDRTLSHFRDRSGRYEQSSSWVVDEALLERIVAAAGPPVDGVVLDLATGTGLVARAFRGRAREVIGLDVSPEMTRAAHERVDRLIIAPMEDIPLPDASVDACVCRQGLQFCDLDRTLSEVARVLKPGGRVAFCHLNAYGPQDRDEAFRIQALRNPARRNFFVPGDLEAALSRAGLPPQSTLRYLSRESVLRWIDHGAGTPEQREAILAAYRSASEPFRRAHLLEERDGDFIDTMLFLIVAAARPEA